MRILAINTAAARLSLSLIEGQDGSATAQTLFSADIEEPRDQGDFLLHTIDTQLKAHGLAYSDIDLMAAVTGPGSFTGIRIGLASMRGFALAAGVPLAGMNSFSLYNHTVEVSTPHRLTVMESWRDELYFQFDSAEPFNVTPATCVAERLADITATSITLLGDAAQKMQPLLQGATVSTQTPTADDLARVLLSQPALRHEEAMPFYLRPPDVSFGQGNRKLQTQ